MGTITNSFVYILFRSSTVQTAAHLNFVQRVKQPTLPLNRMQMKYPRALIHGRNLVKSGGIFTNFFRKNGILAVGLIYIFSLYRRWVHNGHNISSAYFGWKLSGLFDSSCVNIPVSQVLFAASHPFVSLSLTFAFFICVHG